MGFLMTFWQISAWVGILASAGLLYRMAATWDEMTALSKILGMLATVTIGLSSYASYRIGQEEREPIPDVTILLFLTRAAGVMVFLGWPWLLRHIDKEGAKHR